MLRNLLWLDSPPEPVTPVISDPDLVIVNNERIEAARRVFRHSLKLWLVAAGACSGSALELRALNAPVYDIERFGMQFVNSPRHADCLLITGPVTHAIVEPLQRAYAAVPDPKLVIAVGDCTHDGCVFARAYGLAGSLADLLPVDLLIRGCPPTPRTILNGLLFVLGRVSCKPSQTGMLDEEDITMLGM
jgi:Ni,Fe-hydrogenase III small subunit